MMKKSRSLIRNGRPNPFSTLFEVEKLNLVWRCTITIKSQSNVTEHCCSKLPMPENSDVALCVSISMLQDASFLVGAGMYAMSVTKNKLSVIPYERVHETPLVHQKLWHQLLYPLGFQLILRTLDPVFMFSPPSGLSRAFLCHSMLTSIHYPIVYHTDTLSLQ